MANLVAIGVQAFYVFNTAVKSFIIIAFDMMQ